jgi:GNAT superfamily N-acetyltransferase
LNIIISTDKSKLNLAFIHGYLSNVSYWATDRTKAEVKRTIDNSFCVAAFIDGAQVGFDRVVTDYQSFTYIMDVFVAPSIESGGVGTKIIEAILSSHKLENITRFTLATVEAVPFYSILGFEPSQSNYFTLERGHLQR